MKITPASGSTRNLAKYKVDGASVEHLTPPGLKEDIVYCTTCDSLICAHAKAVRRAIDTQGK